MFQKVKNHLKDQRGLTLIELLAVIVILGIIAAIAVPSISGLIDNSKNKATVNEAIQIINAAKLSYAEDNSLKVWKHTADTGETPAFVGLENDIAKVENTGYTVTYANNTFSISGHPAVKIVNENAADDASVTENDLAEYVR